MAEVHGFLNLHKPSGPSSFAMVGLVRKLTGLKRVGHGGTLDPLASGVLPICLGQATRLSDLLLTGRKRYTVGVALGVATDTYDAEGRVVQERDPGSVTLEQVEAALQAFRGRVRQVPPMYSALKRQGQPLYKLARAGLEVERAPRDVEIYHLELADWAPPLLTLEVECSRGTYMRSVAHDLGAALGSGAHMTSLVRTMLGPFQLGNAVSVERLLDAAHGGYWESLTEPIDTVALHMPAAILDEESVRLVQDGRLVPQERPPDADSCRAYGLDGDLVALLSYDAGRQGWQPKKVLAR